jgi:hypothetical protein
LTLAGRRRDLFCLALIGMAYLGIGVLVPVGAEVPLGDSWSYLWSARQLIESGRLVLTDFQSMTLIGQLVLAAPVGLLLSGEPAVLNAFAFHLSAVTAGLFFCCFRALGHSPGASLLATAVLVANPIWLAQSISFDTEIPFLFFSALGLLGLLVWDRGGSGAALWLSMLAFAASVTVRQHGLVYAIAGALFALRRRATRRTPILPFALPVLALAGVYLWIELVHGVPKAFSWSTKMVLGRLLQPGILLDAVAFGLVAAVLYLGLFLLPVLPLWPRVADPRREARPSAGSLLLAVAVLVVGTAGIALRFGVLMPMLPNVVTLEAVARPLGWEGALLWARLVLTALSLVAAAGLLLRVLPRCLDRLVGDGGGPASSSAWTFLAACAALLIAFSLATGLHFDRYLLLPLPFLVPFAVPSVLTSRGRAVVSVTLVSLCLAFSLFFVDQRVRAARCEWGVGQELLRDTGDLHRIDAGVAFNGYYSYDWLSKKYGQHQDNPWPSWVNPEADLVVRGFELRDPRVQQISVRECPNLRGLRPYRAYVYRRTVFGGPPLATLQD